VYVGDCEEVAGKDSGLPKHLWNVVRILRHRRFVQRHLSRYLGVLVIQISKIREGALRAPSVSHPRRGPFGSAIPVGLISEGTRDGVVPM